MRQPQREPGDSLKRKGGVTEYIRNFLSLDNSTQGAQRNAGFRIVGKLQTCVTHLPRDLLSPHLHLAHSRVGSPKFTPGIWAYSMHSTTSRKKAAKSRARLKGTENMHVHTISPSFSYLAVRFFFTSSCCVCLATDVVPTFNYPTPPLT
ncbi:unnamed protein product [Ectocarpus sp. 13 AM-2016]